MFLGRFYALFSLLVYQSVFKWNQYSVTIRSHLDNELEPKEPTLQNMGLLPGLEPMFKIRLLSGERAAAAMGWDVAVRLAKGFSSLAWVDIISTSIKICPIKSLKSENTVKKKRINILTSVFIYTVVRCKYQQRKKGQKQTSVNWVLVLAKTTHWHICNYHCQN